MDLLNMEFWNRVSKLAKEKKLRQVDICEKTNINYKTYQSWIVHSRLPDARDGLKLAKLLNTSLDYLINGEESELLPKDVYKVVNSLLQFNEEERKPIITMIDGQVEYWNKILNK